MTRRAPTTYRVGTDHQVTGVASHVTPHVIAVGEHPVIAEPERGTPRFMSYRVPSIAHRELHRVREQLPEAEVWSLPS